MVDKQGQAKRSQAPRRRIQGVDWLAREMDYRSGMSPEDLAARYGVKIETAKHWPYVHGWREPLTMDDHREKLLTAEIAAAESALSQGDFAAAERRMRAAMAIEKAVRALADIREDKRMDTASGPNDQDVDAPEGGYKAELKRRLLRIVDAVERKGGDAGLAGDAERDRREGDC